MYALRHWSREACFLGLLTFWWALIFGVLAGIAVAAYAMYLTRLASAFIYKTDMEEAANPLRWR